VSSSAQGVVMRILLTRMKFIGDVVLTTPIIRSVRSAYPDAYLAYMGDKQAVPLLEHNPFLDEIIPFDFSRPVVLEQPRVVALLRRRSFNLVIDMFGNPRSALLTYLSGAETRIGPDRRGRGKLYTVRVRDDGTPKTAIDFHNQFIRAAGVEPSALRTEIFLTEDEKQDARKSLQVVNGGRSRLERAGPRVGIHPGATWPAKRWLPERFALLADLLIARLNAQVMVFGGPGEEEVVASVREHASPDVQFLSTMPIRRVAATITHCSLFIANDAAPMHIAAAVGTPTIGLFGPGEENIWFPYSTTDGHVALRKDVPCHPCHLDFCNREGNGHMECMKLLSVEEVFAAAERALERGPTHGSR
jgi:heptosyltransferase III